MSDSDSDDEDLDYYNESEELGECDEEKKEKDPEAFEYSMLSVAEVDKLLNGCVEKVSARLEVTPSLAKMVLHSQRWKVEDILQSCSSGTVQFLHDLSIVPKSPPKQLSLPSTCPICDRRMSHPTVVKEPGSSTGSKGHSSKVLLCGHGACLTCWEDYFKHQVNQGNSTGIECMEFGCHTLIPEDFVLQLVSDSLVRKKYIHLAFNSYIDSHPSLRFCPGPNCTQIAYAEQREPKRVNCQTCSTSFCFSCGNEYHLPTDCVTIRKWLTKCADDSETANYISANTKDCPKCQVCIEKNGGCNHMQCYKCKFDFCWMCLGEWKIHGVDFYECSRYRDNPTVSDSKKSSHKARNQLTKYLFFFERWENHNKSLQFEQKEMENIQTMVQSKLDEREGTWIDWQHLVDSAKLLQKCRYTLKYTYPYAYYMENTHRKTLFEHLQASLELEVENLSWNIEHAAITDRGSLEYQMLLVEKKRMTLLRDSYPETSSSFL